MTKDPKPPRRCRHRVEYPTGWERCIWPLHKGNVHKLEPIGRVSAGTSAELEGGQQ